MTGATLAQGRMSRQRGYRLRVGLLMVLVAGLFLMTLMVGQSITPLGDVIRVIMGEDVAGASFVVGQLRLPRVTVAILTGLSFGLGGVAFQIMLRNPLASPDIIGITSGATTAAVFAIVVLSMTGVQVSAFAVIAGLLVAGTIYLLSRKGGAVGTRIILIGIGVSAMLDSVTSYLLTQALVWNLQEALRWLAGSLNGVKLHQAAPVAAALAVFGMPLLGQTRSLEILRLGDDTAAGLGVSVGRTRAIVITCAVGLIAFATTAAGPIAFVPFLSGPIAAKLIGSRGSLLIPAALVGAVLVVLGDFVGQFGFDTRYPVGVITGAMGAPYLVFLIVRSAKNGSLF
ncbi:iron complex transport system permease protein [Aliiroseovarius halocynthiae]|uniref:Iron chelate uptake ABC transporter family permease subunit n=1 Tax=Aliiroseovarius halocynthiae TaxID=985055 RepID=A0A545SNG8_9RHOB|nr:iron chelate uptake ABC transporter family permease subunit [Aliiroseovarius halocynthiae]TQV66532.1 iron chelate uptake ABC transporter family permease subunit [Aliiroseovarius halocynthiae]SMR82599.1 iron complex transport system permease protein [Aliiroseovarius halocynthiae]